MLRKITIFIIIVFLYSCNNLEKKQTINFFALNTTCSVSVYNHVKIDLDRIPIIVDEIEKLMSSHLDSSEISLINMSAGIDYVKVNQKTFEIIEQGIEFSKLSNGVFDISIGPLVKLWDISNKQEVPENSNINKSKELIDYTKILMNKNSLSVKLEVPNMALDLGAIAKGYASNELKEYLKSLGVKSAIINLGGNIDLIGRKSDDSLWTIGIQHPRKERGEFIGILKGENISFVSSGDYERFFIKDGIRYHHILNPKTGFPKYGQIIGSSIINKSSVKGDALSTITFGSTISYIKELNKEVEFEGVFITDDKMIYITPGLHNIFTLKDETYKIIE